MNAPTERAATDKDAGRSCPYCRFALKGGTDVVECGECHAPHHADCWGDNGGCAMMGCAAAPAPGVVVPPPAPAVATGAAPPVPPPPPPVRSSTAPPPPPPPTPPAPPSTPGGGGSSRTILAIAVLVLALAVAGAAAAYVISTKNKKAGADTRTLTFERTEPTTSEPEPPDEEPASALPDVPESQMESDIRDVLLSHHRAVVRGNYKVAWVLTTERYRRKKLGEPGGYDEWVAAQRTLSSHLQPEGLRVHIREKDPVSGVATIDASGMGWSKAGSPCSRWEGVTWVKYENDHWRYEPGYSISDQRRAKWQPREGETLGWDC